MSRENRGDGGVLLTVAGLCASYGPHRALLDLSFDVRRGEIIGLLGPNGSGKSTALAVLSGLVRASGGTVTLGGASVPMGGAAFRRRLGVVFQTTSLDDRLTALENLRLAAGLYGVPGAVATARIRELLDFFELSGRAEDAVRTYSGGMKRRLDLARALVHGPEVLLLDEPTTGLDEATFRKTWDRLKALRERDLVSILVATHRAEEAAMADRLVVLDQGRRVLFESPRELLCRVEDDVVSVEVDELDSFALEVEQHLGLSGERGIGRIVYRIPRGHEMVPQLARLSPHLRGISIRSPSLADAFLKVTGHSLERPEEETP